MLATSWVFKTCGFSASSAATEVAGAPSPGEGPVFDRVFDDVARVARRAQLICAAVTKVGGKLLADAEDEKRHRRLNIQLAAEEAKREKALDE